jgi:hypothetical protein
MHFLDIHGVQEAKDGEGSDANGKRYKKLTEFTTPEEATT